MPFIIKYRIIFNELSTYKHSEGGESMNNFVAKISSLRKQLIDLGYYEFQLDSIMEETVDTVNIENLTEEQYRELINILEEYARFAVKCRIQRHGKSKK